MCVMIDVVENGLNVRMVRGRLEGYLSMERLRILAAAQLPPYSVKPSTVRGGRAVPSAYHGWLTVPRAQLSRDMPEYISASLCGPDISRFATVVVLGKDAIIAESE